MAARSLENRIEHSEKASCGTASPGAGLARAYMLRIVLVRAGMRLVNILRKVDLEVGLVKGRI
jgi:hypothetical protein